MKEIEGEGGRMEGEDKKKKTMEKKKKTKNSPRIGFYREMERNKEE